MILKIKFNISDMGKESCWKKNVDKRNNTVCLSFYDYGTNFNKS